MKTTTLVRRIFLVMVAAGLTATISVSSAFAAGRMDDADSKQTAKEKRAVEKRMNSVWKTAEQLGVSAFVPRTRHELRDDHLPLNQIAQIPTIDIIDFDYPRPGIGAPSYWHTQQDIPANCSGESLAAVIWVVHQWLIQQSQI